MFYFRRGKGKRTRLPDLNSPDFEERYHEALTSDPPKKRVVATQGTLKWLVARYRETAEYGSLSEGTRKYRDNIYRAVVEAAGDKPYKNITKKVIARGKEDRAATPGQARNFLDAMRGLFRWAYGADLVKEDPTAGVKNPPRRNVNGFVAWTEDDVAAYEKRWKEGTKERVWLHVLLYTGLRRGDAVRIGKQHVRNGVATLKTEKTNTEVNIPILPDLEHTLAVGPTGDLAFIVGETGTPLTKESFGNMFREACNEAGIKKSAHGVRKIGATRAAESGLTVNELEALYGWTGGRMASYYTRTADRKRLALAAAEKIKNAQRPHPLEAVTPHPKQKQ